MTRDWLCDAAQRYEACNRATLGWLLARPPLGEGFLDTKVNALSGADYDTASGVRGPDYVYGWIQGRGLEALVTFADHYRTRDPGLAEQLRTRAQHLYAALAALHARDGHGYFLYDRDRTPVRLSGDAIVPQTPAGPIYTYSDAFMAKGLFAASTLFAPERTGHYLDYLQAVIGAIGDGRFQMDETAVLSRDAALAEPDDFGPRMILLGAAGVLHRADTSGAAGFADRFIDEVLERYHDPASGLLRNCPGQDACNVGHGIEFCGFAFEHLAHRPDDPRIGRLAEVLVHSLDKGLQGPGIALSLSVETGAALSPYYPWWPMPEAIRACALGLKLTGNDALQEPWKKADAAFFGAYWQAAHAYAWQTRTLDGPVNFVPATPDLDPGYHTGLSLLGALTALEGMGIEP